MNVYVVVMSGLGKVNVTGVYTSEELALDAIRSSEKIDDELEMAGLFTYEIHCFPLSGYDDDANLLIFESSEVKTGEEIPILQRVSPLLFYTNASLHK